MTLNSSWHTHSSAGFTSFRDLIPYQAYQVVEMTPSEGAQEIRSVMLLLKFEGEFIKTFQSECFFL